MNRIGAYVFLLACGPVWGATDSRPTTPTAKQAIAWLLDNSRVPLSVDASCRGAGTDFSDKTLGQYVAGFMAEQVTPGQNWIEASCSKPEMTGASWTCSVNFLRQDNEENWKWGVKFSVDSRGHVLPRSFRCTGAG